MERMFLASRIFGHRGAEDLRRVPAKISKILFGTLVVGRIKVLG